MPIKAELGLSDSQIDALTGLAFSLGTLLGFGASGWLGEAFGWRLLSQDLEAMESGSARPTPRPTNPKPEEAGF